MTNPAPDAIAPSLDYIAQLAHDAVANLPEPWRTPATQVVLRIEDFAPDEMLEAMDLHDPFELTGLYEGVPMTQKSVSDPAPHPDIVWLFRRAILDEWAERGDVSIADLVTHVTIHEFAHHFGWSDDDIAAIDPWWE
ncbi:metallopeptidase family protein [Neotabrizicola sp. sgz301269]|uniref:metallopeptidase family protein n=1 Tax=Neotabrizicola sp. sgz301269 TaxID=3276282 RepID=UPI00376F8125